MRAAENQEIKNRNFKQLKQYVKWEREVYPDDLKRLHVLDWAVEEIKYLRGELNQYIAASKSGGRQR